MGNVIPFAQPFLKPFLGEWILDQVSVSRNKLSKLLLGEEGAKKLWACASIDEINQIVGADPELGDKYRAMLGERTEGRLTVAPAAILWTPPRAGLAVATVLSYPVMKIVRQGGAIVVHSLDPRPGRRGRPAGLRLRLSKNWLMMSEEFFGRKAEILPQAPALRFYPAR